MKNASFLPLLFLSAYTLAEQVVPESTSARQNEQTLITAQQPDPILPLLSLEMQQARAKELAQQAENAIQQAEQQRLEAEKRRQLEERIQREIGQHQLLLKERTTQIYLDNGLTAMWSDSAAVKLFLKEYALFAASGVSAKSTKAFTQILNMPEGLALDILLTDSFLDYLYYNHNVVKNADKWLYQLGGYVPKAPEDNLIALWEVAVKGGSSAQFIANLVPSNHIYQETVEKLLSVSTHMHTTVETNVKAKKSKEAKPAKEAVINSETFAKLALNVQRLRLIPSFDNGIFVNIPSYQLYYMRDGKLALQSKVIVGRDDRRTPVMYSKLSNVVVNPPWNVPPTIKAQDLVPKFSRNPSLVESSGYEILDSSGKKVNPYSINWAQYKGKERSFPYHIRQKPGDNAALGLYKFNMPSSDAIYLHDTPNRGLFGKEYRALSSGCVRVAKSDELATLLLKEAGWTEEKKQSVLVSRKTTSAPIRSDNPVYLYYVTAWVEGGKIHTLPDIYKYDTQLPRVALDWQAIKQKI